MVSPLQFLLELVPALHLVLHLDVEALLNHETSGICLEMQNCTKNLHLVALSALFLELDLDVMALFLAASYLWLYLDVGALGLLSPWFLKLWLGVEGAPALPRGGQSAASSVLE